jgi:ParB family chromosome partitioning protein
MATKKTTRRRPRSVSIEPVGLEPTEVAVRALPEAVEALATSVRSDGGDVVGQYLEPLGGHVLLVVALPIDKVRPTPFQRDVSEAHVKKLMRAMDKTKRFLDPIIAVRQNDVYFTPNGHHRLTALRQLGAKTAIALLVPEFDVAYQILALNIEKAHTLRERSLEVMRMYSDLVQNDDDLEKEFEFEFEEPALVTLGFAYEARPRLAGGAYHSVLRKVDTWIDARLSQAKVERGKRATLLLDLDDAVNFAVNLLKERGLKSPYLKNFVVARVNPLRFIKGDPPPLGELLVGMAKKARGLDVTKVNPQDLARSGGAGADDE